MVSIGLKRLTSGDFEKVLYQNQKIQLDQGAIEKINLNFKRIVKLNLIFYLLVAFCLMSCGMKIYSDFDHNLSIKKYKTFGWSDNEKLDIKENPLYDAQTEKVIQREVARQLSKRDTYSLNQNQI